MSKVHSFPSLEAALRAAAASLNHLNPALSSSSQRIAKETEKESGMATTTTTKTMPKKISPRQTPASSVESILRSASALADESVFDFWESASSASSSATIEREKKMERDSILLMLGDGRLINNGRCYGENALLAPPAPAAATSNATATSTAPSPPPAANKGGGGTSDRDVFPAKLHRVLTQLSVDGHDSILSWLPHGRAVKVHRPTSFASHVVRPYFGMAKASSFTRQLNIYGFKRITSGNDRGAYYHPLFLRGRPELLGGMRREATKGTGVGRKKETPGTDPNFYRMTPLDEEAERAAAKPDRMAKEEEKAAEAHQGFQSRCPSPQLCQLQTPTAPTVAPAPAPVISQRRHRPDATDVVASAINKAVHDPREQQQRLLKSSSYVGPPPLMEATAPHLPPIMPVPACISPGGSSVSSQVIQDSVGAGIGALIPPTPPSLLLRPSSVLNFSNDEMAMLQQAQQREQQLQLKRQLEEDQDPAFVAAGNLFFASGEEEEGLLPASSTLVNWLQETELFQG